MITKIEINGFKTFTKFQMEFAPLTIIAGTNASGKSNLFDAMQLLSRIVDTDLKTAFSEQRGSASELFTLYENGSTATEISFAIELLLDKNIKDKFGGTAQLKYTRLRYEIAIKQIINDRGVQELVIVSEFLNPIRHELDKWLKVYIPKKGLEKWRPKVISGKRGVAYIDTDSDRVNLRQDGKGGIKKEFSLNNINQAIISVVNSVDFPHALGAKEEIKNWRFLQLNPEDLRQPSSYLAKDDITHTGQNLAAALHRIKNSDPISLMQINRRLNALLPSISSVDVIDDKVGKQFVIQVKTQDGRVFTSRVLSEGTLRLLTLCVFLFDKDHKGLLCFEEPENGVHPARMKLTAKLLMDLVSHFEEDVDQELRQVIVNTHSPVLVGDSFKLNNQNVCRIWLSQLITQFVTINHVKQKIQITKMLPVVKGASQLSIDFSENERKLTLASVVDYLQTSDFEQEIQQIEDK
ncbi:ATPase [Niastella vici]|uniref:ATPase n=1 Tax=Niastella vici TaxID=1703345 RepID=A0A1V9FLS0_9BACT|nr:AAA family ATPase [Niastella vici]OQP59257.1 ATPase [Niastella vici]